MAPDRTGMRVRAPVSPPRPAPGPAPRRGVALMGEEVTIHQALAAVMADVRAVRKDGRNTQQNYNFRGIDGVLNAVGPAFRSHGVFAVPLVEDATYNTVEVGKNRTQMREVTLRVRYQFFGPDGDHVDAVVMAESLDSGDKATAKCLSVAFRSALLQVLAIPTDDPDPDTHSYVRADAPQPDPAHAVMRAQKRQLIDAAGGDGDLAKTIWGDHDGPVGEQVFANMLTQAEQMGSQ